MQISRREVPSTRSAVIILGVLLLLLPAAILAAYVLPSPAAIVVPVPVEPVDSLIRIEGTAYESQGGLYLTAVRVASEPRLGQYLLAQLQPNVQVVPKGEVVPPSLTREEFQRLSQRLLLESQTIAQIVALRKAGYDVKAGDSEVEVVSTVPGTPAAAQLLPGDVIESVNGQDVATTAEVVSIANAHLTGESVTLRVRRHYRTMTVAIPTLRGPVDTEGPVLGLVLMTTGLDFRAPISIKMEAGHIVGGPSAGLMYALGVYNALSTEDLTRGRRIAGTGTLRLDGTVGPVGAVRLKVRAAEEAGVEYFLVPAEDAAAARAAARQMQIIPVHSFEEALAALRQIGTDTGRSPRIVPAGGDTILAGLVSQAPGYLPSRSTTRV